MTIEQKKNKSNIDVIASVSEAIPYKKEIATAFSKPRNDAWRKTAFTLAEVLIVISVIGIVAAITIPGLNYKISTKKRYSRMINIEQKLQQGVKLICSQGRVNKFSSTKEFVEGLSKTMKISLICDSNNLAPCWPAEKIKIEGKEVPISDITSPAWFGLSEDEGFKDIVGFITGDGTPWIVSYSTDCTFDDSTIGGYAVATQCVRGIYDYNGKAVPNTYGVDNSDVNRFGVIDMKNEVKHVWTISELESLGFYGISSLPNGAIIGNNMKENNGNHNYSVCRSSCISKGLRLPTKSEAYEDMATSGNSNYNWWVWVENGEGSTGMFVRNNGQAPQYSSSSNGNCRCIAN